MVPDDHNQITMQTRSPYIGDERDSWWNGCGSWPTLDGKSRPDTCPSEITGN